MLKLLGACLILSAAIVLGMQLRQQLSEHVRQLMAFKEVLTMLAGEISYGKTPLAEAFRHIAERGKEPFGQFLLEVADRMEQERSRTLYDIWQEAVKKHSETFIFSKEEIQMLTKLGENFGYLDVQMQLKHLAIYEQQAEEKLLQAQQELAVKQKLYQYLSVMSGLFLILLFI